MAVGSKSRRLSKLGGAGFLVFVALCYSGVTLYFDNVIGRNAYRQIQALGYSKVMGSVTRSEVEVHPKSHSLKFHYKYSVAGKEYLGERYRYNQESPFGDGAHRIVASHPVGSQVEVHYAPADPSDAVLAVGIEGMDLFLAMIMLPFNLGMLGFWIVGSDGFRDRLFLPSTGGASVSEDSRYVRVRLSICNPLYSGTAVAGKLAFSGAFVIGFGFGGDPSLHTMLVAWGVIFGGGVLGWLFHHWRLAGGQSDLLIDHFRSSLTLPRTSERKEDLVIPAGKIVAIEVEKVENRSSKGDADHSYIPTVVFTDNDGSRRRERIIEWPFEARAERLAAWLRERLQIEAPTSGDV